MAFTAKDVQALRERTGVGMMDCKKALTEADGDMDKAVDILREKGLAAAAKKSGRIAAEGVVHAVYDEAKHIGVVVEVNSETDFVAKNDSFISFVKDVANTIADQDPADTDALAGLKMFGSERTVAENLQDKILTIGENIKIRRFVRAEGVASIYVHGGGRIGVMVEFEADPAKAASAGFREFGKNIAMQVAASTPLFTDIASVPSETLEHEKKILTEQVMNEGKPANIAEKIVAGKIAKYYKDVCLLEQPYVKDPDLPVKKYIEDAVREIGCPIAVKAFTRYEKGEGLQKKEDNFAEEVAGMVK